MQITVHDEGGVRTIAVSGRMDTVSAPQLEDAIEQNADAVQAVILDLQALTYTSSAGLRVLLRAQKRIGTSGSLTLRHVQPDVMDVLEMTGFDSILTIE